MNIGLDIDNVITAFDNSILKEFLLEDKNKRNTGIINKHAKHINNGMFDWSREEVDEFYNNNMERIAKEETVKNIWTNFCKTDTNSILYHTEHIPTIKIQNKPLLIGLKRTK